MICLIKISLRYLQLYLSLTKKDVNADRKNSQFTGDVPHIPEEFRASNKDYLGSGWSRGRIFIIMAMVMMMKVRQRMT